VLEPQWLVITPVALKPAALMFKVTKLGDEPLVKKMPLTEAADIGLEYVMVYAGARFVMSTFVARPGTMPTSQLRAVFQSPPARLVQLAFCACAEVHTAPKARANQSDGRGWIKM